MSEATVALTPILTRGWGSDRSWTLESYLSRGGYEGLKKANTMEPAEIVETVKASGLRGRGGAGFPTGLKWSFLPPDDGLPRYLVVNADESEPGTCKDIPTIMANPHVLIEGIAITSRAINCHHAFVYLRGEVVHVYRRLMLAGHQLPPRFRLPARRGRSRLPSPDECSKGSNRGRPVGRSSHHRSRGCRRIHLW